MSTEIRDYEDALFEYRLNGGPRRQIRMHEARKALERHPDGENERRRAAVRVDQVLCRLARPNPDVSQAPMRPFARSRS